METNSISYHFEPIPVDYVEKGYNHIGDIEIKGELLIAPIEESSHTKPGLFFYNKTDYSFINMKVTN